MRKLFAAALLCLFAFPVQAFDRHDPSNPWRSEMSAPSPYQKRTKAKKVQHDRIPVAAVATSGTRPSGCPHAWCGCWLSIQKFGQNIRKLWVARNWAHEGTAAPKGCTGCVAVLSRGRGGHVGIVQSWDGPNPVILSGNHNRRVGVGTYSSRRIIALRWV